MHLIRIIITKWYIKIYKYTDVNRGDAYMFISVMFWSILGAIVVLGGYVAYSDKRDSKKEKDDLF